MHYYVPNCSGEVDVFLVLVEQDGGVHDQRPKRWVKGQNHHPVEVLTEAPAESSPHLQCTTYNVCISNQYMQSLLSGVERGFVTYQVQHLIGHVPVGQRLHVRRIPLHMQLDEDLIHRVWLHGKVHCWRMITRILGGAL